MSGQQGTSQDQTIDPGIDTRLSTRTLAEKVAELPECSTFSDLVRKAGLDQLLRRSGLRTLFAPKNEALAGTAPGDLEDFLERHMAQGGLNDFDLRRCQTLKMVAGNTVPVRYRDGVLEIGGASIERADLQCTNGVLHIISSALET